MQQQIKKELTDKIQKLSTEICDKIDKIPDTFLENHYSTFCEMREALLSSFEKFNAMLGILSLIPSDFFTNGKTSNEETKPCTH